LICCGNFGLTVLLYVNKFFVEKIKRLIFARKLRYKRGNPDGMPTKDVMAKMMNELMQYSTSATNDSFQTSLCLQFSPDEIATACLYLACQFAGVEPIEGLDWRIALGDPDIESFVSICVQILGLMSEKKASDTEEMKKIKTALELMRSQVERQQQQQRVPMKRPPPTVEGRNTPPPPRPPPAGSPNKRPRHG
jgi:hypothetical protein